MLALEALFVQMDSLALGALLALSVLVAKLGFLGQEALMVLVAAYWREGLLPVLNTYLLSIFTL